jgi:outer membrane protein assembly factor BamB
MRYRASDQLGIVDRGVAYLTNYGGGVYVDPWMITAQDVVTGDILWTKSTASNVDRILPVLASGDTLYVQHGQAIEAWDRATGDLRWSRTSTNQVTPLAATPGAVYLRWQNGDRHGIVRWGASDGRTNWRIHTPATDTPFVFTPSAVYESGPNFLAAWSASSGSILWKRKGFFWSYLGQPVYAGGVLWAFQQGSLESYDAANGDELLSESIAAPGPITVAGGRVFIGSTDGRVFIYQLPT